MILNTCSSMLYRRRGSKRSGKLAFSLDFRPLVWDIGTQRSAWRTGTPVFHLVHARAAEYRKIASHSQFNQRLASHRLRPAFSWVHPPHHARLACSQVESLLVSLKFPLCGFGLVCCAVLLYLRPEPPGVRGDGADTETEGKRKEDAVISLG